MPALTPTDLIQALNWRYATKKFDPSRKIPADLWKTLEQALVLAPSSLGLQPWRFVVVTDPAVKQRLRAVSWNQPQVEDCSHLVVFSAKRSMTTEDIEHFLDRIVEVRGVSKETLAGYRDRMVGSVVKGPLSKEVDQWMARQVYIALGVFLTSAAVLGVDACPMEGFEPDRYDEILGLSASGHHAFAISAAGYRAEDDVYGKLAKVRYPVEEVITRF